MNYPSFWIRFLAHLIDFTITNVAELSVQYAILGIVYVTRRFVLSESIEFSQTMNSMLEQGIAIVFGLGFAYFYYVKLQLKRGTTIGKGLFSIYVVDAVSQAPMTEKQALIRLVSYLPSYLILGCGFLMAAFHPERRALHDLFAGTVCIRKPRS